MGASYPLSGRLRPQRRVLAGAPAPLSQPRDRRVPADLCDDTAPGTVPGRAVPRRDARVARVAVRLPEPRLVLHVVLHGQLAERAEPEAAHGGCARARAARAARVHRRVRVAEALPRAELVRAQLVQLVELEVACLVAQLEQRLEPRGGGREELHGAREDGRVLRRGDGCAQIGEDVCVSGQRSVTSVIVRSRRGTYGALGLSRKICRDEEFGSKRPDEARCL